MRALIVGGGVAGLATAIALRRAAACRLRDAGMKAIPERLGRVRLGRIATFAS
jgi:glycine/D-amino acid oxidase-like deaminating enzyme